MQAQRCSKQFHAWQIFNRFDRDYIGVSESGRSTTLSETPILMVIYKKLLFIEILSVSRGEASDNITGIGFRSVLEDVETLDFFFTGDTQTIDRLDS